MSVSNSKGKNFVEYYDRTNRSKGAAALAGMKTNSSSRPGKASAGTGGRSSRVYSSYADAIDGRSRLLEQQRQLAYQRRKRRYDAAVRQNDRQAREDMRQAYLARMMARKNLPRLLRAAGISGGMSESSAADIENTYMNNRSGIERRRRQANAAAKRAFDRGVDSDYSEYLAGMYDLQKGMAGNRTVKKSRSAKSVSAVPASGLRNVTAQSGGLFDGGGFDSFYDNVAQNLIRLYRRQGYSESRARALARTRGAGGKKYTKGER